MRIRIQSRIIRVFAPITGKKQYCLLETILGRTPELKKKQQRLQQQPIYNTNYIHT